MYLDIRGNCSSRCSSLDCIKMTLYVKLQGSSLFTLVKTTDISRRDYSVKLKCCCETCNLFHYYIITDSVVLWKVQKFDWLIPETK